MKNGPYELVIAPDNYPGKKYRDRYCYEHILNYWLYTGIFPQLGYEIHHINGNHRDNRIENLQLVTSEEHRKIHGALKKVDLWYGTCNNCNIGISLQARNYRYKTNRGQKFFFCSQKCQGIFQHKNGGKLR